MIARALAACVLLLLALAPLGPTVPARAQTTGEAIMSEAAGAGAVVQDAAATDWTGDWRSFWRTGQALMSLRQEGRRITGTYQPGDGRIEGEVEGVLFTGTWAQPGSEGVFEFAMAPDGRSFVGRYGNGEYWNGTRLDGLGTQAVSFGADTPRAALASLVSAINAAAAGDSVAELRARSYLVFPDDEPALMARNDRIIRLARLIDAATFQLYRAPAMGQNGEAAMLIGPAGTDYTFPLTFLEDAEGGSWALRVPSEAALGRYEEGLLAATGARDFEELAAMRASSPRQALRDFVQGTSAWAEGGRARALAVLDLSAIPEHLRGADGPIAAEYLRQILDRLGQAVWQEIPDDPARRRPLLIYENAGGKVLIGPHAAEEAGEPVRWLFTADTIAAAPAIFAAMQNLPLAEGVQPSPPITRAFQIRSRVGQISPDLLKRGFLLENWQWLALLATVLVSVLGSWIVQRVLQGLVGGAMRLLRATEEARADVARVVKWPTRTLVAGAILAAMVREIGLRQDVSALVNGLSGLLLVASGTFFLYHVVGAITGALARGASRTTTQIDDVVVMLGGGLARVAVILGGVVMAAEVVGLPYEGVIAALGVGGLALGIAARDAVSNFIGAGILMTDRPFKKGDLIEANGQMGVVEEVGLRSTRLRTLDDALLVVPNSKMSEEQVNNWGRLRNRRIDLTLGVTYDTPRATLDAFVDRLRALFEASPHGKPGVFVALNDFGPSSIDIRLLGYFNTADFRTFTDAKHKLIGDIVDLAAEMGVEFAFPTQTVHVAGQGAGIASLDGTRPSAA